MRADTGTTTARPETMNARAIWRDGCSHPDGDGGDPRRRDVGGDSDGDGGDPDDGEGSDPGR